MTQLYQMFGGGAQPVRNTPAVTNPFQMMMTFSRAMRNPVAFIKEQFPDIPDQISNDPNQILSYLQRTRGISDQEIQQMYGMAGSQMPTMNR